MRRFWLLLSQAVTVGVAAVLVIALFYPQTLPWRPPPATVMLGSAGAGLPVERRDGLPSYSAAAAVAMPSVVSVYTAKAPPRGPQRKRCALKGLVGCAKGATNSERH